MDTPETAGLAGARRCNDHDGTHATDHHEETLVMFYLQQQLLRSFDVGFINKKAKHWVAFKYLQDNSHSSLLWYRTLQPEYKYADYLSAVRCYSNRRLLSNFRSGCHGLHVDTGRWENNVHLDKKDSVFSVQFITAC